MTKIGLIGDFNSEVVAHIAIGKAIELAAKELDCHVEVEWLPTPSLGEAYEQKLATFHGLWCVPASPYASMQGALNGIKFARENNIPFLGTCGGFQHMIIEFARNVLKLEDADHAEMNPTASLLLVAPLTCSISEQHHTFNLTASSKVATSYGTTEVTEQYGICNYGLNDIFAPLFNEAGMHIVGVDEQNETRIMELTNHPFFVGTLFQPERSAWKEIVHPLIREFVRTSRK